MWHCVLWDMGILEMVSVCVCVCACNFHRVLTNPGNLHLNVVEEGHTTKILELLEPFVFDWTGQHICCTLSDTLTNRRYFYVLNTLHNT